ncbi:MAG TPA: hypothetical protein VGO96_07000 [Pyrinomonadaceae bacterium]|jgi:hypothetical protein|nr:hypothetical protein [Pyrinomonadaceae bacterium]
MRRVDKPRLSAGCATLRLSRKVIILLLCGLSLSLGGACSKKASSRDERKASKPAKSAPATERPPVAGSANYDPPVRLANLEDRRIDESSGIVASRANPGLYWTHNDSGDDALIYAFDRDGKSQGVWRVTGASALDWEDIAAGPGAVRGTSYLYIGDTGDNKRDGKVVTVYRVAEPSIEPVAGSNSRAGSFQTAPAEAIRLEFPDGKHDAEALLIHPQTGDLYIITKTKRDAAKVYKATAPFDASTIIPLAFVSDLQLPGVVGGLVTGGDISPDGQRIVLCDYFGAYEIALPRGVSNFDSIWQQPPAPIDLGARQQGEAVCYRLDGKAILATSEETPTPLIEVLRKE